MLAHVSVHPSLARRVLDGRGGLFDGDPSRGGGSLRADAHLRNGHQRSRPAEGEGRHLSADRMQEYTENYIAAGGKRAFSEYYVAKYDGRCFLPALTRNVVFSQHNLVTDRSFSGVQRHSLPERPDLLRQDAAGESARLFYDSLAMFGILALGSKESLRFSPYEECYEQINGPEKIYRKVR